MNGIGFDGPSAEWKLSLDQDQLILLGPRHVASSIPTTSPTGVAIGVGLTFSLSIMGTPRNPASSSYLIRRALIGFPSAEVSGSIGLAYSLLSLHALLKGLILYLEPFKYASPIFDCLNYFIPLNQDVSIRIDIYPPIPAQLDRLY